MREADILVIKFMKLTPQERLEYRMSDFLVFSVYLSEMTPNPRLIGANLFNAAAPSIISLKISG